MTSSVYEKIKASKKLPSPTGVALQVLELAERDDTSMAEISRVVESDPAIAARLLKLVNTPLAGMPRQIVSVSRAVALLGTRTVTSLALSFSLISQHRQGGCPSFDHNRFWSASLARAVAARHVSARLGGCAPDEAFTFGLLSEMGKLGLAMVYPETYGSAASATRTDDPLEYLELERSLFEIDHVELTAQMMADWHLPEIFRDAVRLQFAPIEEDGVRSPRARMFARILRVSGSVARVVTNPAKSQDDLTAVLLEMEQLGIAAAIVPELFDAVVTEWQSTGEILSIDTHDVTPVVDMYSQARDHHNRLRAGAGEPTFPPDGIVHDI